MKPIGVYGSTEAIVEFLRKAECIDEETYCDFVSFSSLPQSSFSALLLLSPPSPANAAQQSLLRPGLYLLRSSIFQPGIAYIIFWPEETTWDDNTSGMISRNRTIFMRYLFPRRLQELPN